MWTKKNDLATVTMTSPIDIAVKIYVDVSRSGGHCPYVLSES